MEHLRESLRRSEETGDIDGVARGYVNLSEMVDEDGRIEEAAGLALEGAGRAAALGSRAWQLLLEGEAATRLISLGRLDEADRLTEAALALQSSIAALLHRGARALIEVQRGRTDQARQLMRAAEDVMPYVPGATWTEPIASTRSELELLTGHPEDARRLGEQTLAMAADGEKVVFTARLHAVTARAGAVLAERARAASDEPTATDAAIRAQTLVDRIDRLLAPEHWRGPPPPETLSRRAMAQVKAKIRDRTDRRYARLPLKWAVEDLNHVLRGWGNYFRYGNSAEKFGAIDCYVNERLAILASAKHGLNGRNWVTHFNHQWGNQLGIHRLTGTGRPTTAHASR